MSPLNINCDNCQQNCKCLIIFPSLCSKLRMPKRRDRSVSSDRYRASPFPSSSSRVKRCYTKVPFDTEENIKEWEEARCSVCMEHPHNAILLICTSHAKGCRPYMCDTSYRHSNCFDQFRRSFATIPSTVPLQVQGMTSDEHLPYSTVQENDISQQVEIPDRNLRTSSEMTSEGAAVSTQQQLSSEVLKFLCPLCRGQVKDWIVVDAARSFMNAKSRSCACETCEFVGTYTDLRKHARVEHPLARPTEADPERQRTWRRLERQRDLGDLLSTLQSSFGEERREEEEENSILPIVDRGWLTVFFLIRVFQPRRSGLSSRRSSSSSRSAASRVRERLSSLPRRRRSARLWSTNSHNGDAISLSTEEDNSDDGDSHTQRQLRHIRRRTAPNDEHS